MYARTCITIELIFLYFFLPQIICMACNKETKESTFQCYRCKSTYHPSCHGKRDIYSEELCRTCCLNKIGLFNYEECILRLRNAYLLGSKDCMISAAKREEDYITLYGNDEKTSRTATLEQILAGNEIATHDTGNPGLVALATHEDGNCLFNATSTHLHGNEEYSTELRCRTIVEMSLNMEWYEQQLQCYLDADNAPVYGKDSVLGRCTVRGTFCGIGEMLALSTVVHRKIRVHLTHDPNLGCSRDFEFRSRTHNTAPEDDVLLLWTGSSGKGVIEAPNHFMPMLPTTCMQHNISNRSDVDLDAGDSDSSYGMPADVEERATKIPPTNQPKFQKGPNFLSMEELICHTQFCGEKFTVCPKYPEKSGIINLTSTDEEALNDGWRWRNTGKGHVQYVNNEGHLLHKQKNGFIKKMRMEGCNRYRHSDISESEEVYMVQRSFFKHASSEGFRKRLSAVRQVQPNDSDSHIIIEYSRLDDASLCFPPHGNSKNRETPFYPTSRSIICQGLLHPE